MQDTCEEALMRVIASVLAMLAFGCSQPDNPVIDGRRVSLLIEGHGDNVPGVTGDFTAKIFTVP